MHTGLVTGPAASGMGKAMEAGKGAQAAKIPPHLILHEFLEGETADALYDYACAHEADFAPTRTFAGVNPRKRISLATRDLSAFRPMLGARLRALAPEFVARLQVSPFEDFRVELELAAHGDGAFYASHIDTATGDAANAAFNMRVVSAVYYFHRRPKAYEGGQLRLYSFFTEEEFMDIEPEHNSLLVFPSWARHEVRPVRVPSKRFADYRFAINGWFRKAR